jgi:hypothetical protein
MYYSLISLARLIRAEETNVVCGKHSAVSKFEAMEGKSEGKRRKETGLKI